MTAPMTHDPSRCTHPHATGIEVQGVYDGVLIWDCPQCGMVPRFATGDRRHDAALGTDRAMEGGRPMTAHDPLCVDICICEQIARVRADENMKVCRCGCMERDAHAEAVAARLVEVICEQRDEFEAAWDAGSNTFIGTQFAEAVASRLVEVICRMDEDGTSAKDWARMCREANAAACKAMDERDAARAEVAALRELNWATIAAEQKILLDRLRAKVEGLRDSKGRAGSAAGMLIWRHDVLALFEEVGR